MFSHCYISIQCPIMLNHTSEYRCKITENNQYYIPITDTDTEWQLIRAFLTNKIYLVLFLCVFKIIKANNNLWLMKYRILSDSTFYNFLLILICSVPPSTLFIPSYPLFPTLIQHLSSPPPSVHLPPSLHPQQLSLTLWITQATTGTIGPLPSTRRPETVSQQINALLTDWSAPAGLEPASTVALLK